MNLGLRRASGLSGVVRERGRFTVREAVGRGGSHEYRLADLDATVTMRHNGADAWVLNEVLTSRAYRPPPEVEAVLPAPQTPHRVVDLGGNIGGFGLLILKTRPGAQVVAFEPEANNARLLRRTIDRNDLHDRWTVIEACAAASDGEVQFVEGEAALSRAALPGDEPTATLPALDVFPHLDGVALLKVDIEGGEWDLLADERFPHLAPPAVVLEWHSYQCAATNPRTEAERRLRAMGYDVLHELPAPVPPAEHLYGAGLLWAFRPPTGSK